MKDARKVIDLQMKIGEVSIADIKFDLRSRDEIPKLFCGLQGIYCNRKIREQGFEIFKKIVPGDNDDPNSIGLVHHYQSLMPMAQEARKPVPGIDLQSIPYVFGKHRNSFWINTASRIYFLINLIYHNIPKSRLKTLVRIFPFLLVRFRVPGEVPSCFLVLTLPSLSVSGLRLPETREFLLLSRTLFFFDAIAHIVPEKNQ